MSTGHWNEVCCMIGTCHALHATSARITADSVRQCFEADHLHERWRDSQMHCTAPAKIDSIMQNRRQLHRLAELLRVASDSPWQREQGQERQCWWALHQRTPFRSAVAGSMQSQALQCGQGQRERRAWGGGKAECMLLGAHSSWKG